jgi:hypothetical protein
MYESENEDEDEDDLECCEDWDELSSHYHCPTCGERCSMMGHPEDCEVYP